MLVKRICQGCGKVFSTSLSRIKDGRGKFCSKERHYKNLRGGIKQPSKELLEKLYVEDKMSLRQIRDLLGVGSVNTVWVWMEKYGIDRRTGSVAKQGRKHSKQWNRNIGEGLKGNKNRVGKTPSSPFPKGHTPWNKGKGNPWLKEKNKDPEFIKRRLKGCELKPNKLERRVIKIIKNYDLPYCYVGDGQVIIGHVCPDFINNNGAKRIIEVFGDYWHDPTQNKDCRWFQTEEGRTELLANYGFETLILWESQINEKPDDEIARVITKFERC